MDVNIPQPFICELAAFYELQHFIVIGNGCQWKVFEQGEYFRPVPQVAASKFADDKQVTDDVALIQYFQVQQSRIENALSKPRCQPRSCYISSVLRREIVCKSCSVPANPASRFALSLAISA